MVGESPVAAWLKLRDGRFRAFSASFADGLGISQEDASRARDSDFFTDSEVRRFRSDDRRVSSSGQPEVFLVPPDSLTPAAWGATIKIPIRHMPGTTMGFSHSLDTLLPLERLVGASLGEGAGRRGRSVTDQARYRLDRMFLERVRVSDLAGELGRHPDHLAKSFRVTISSTIAEYVRARRVAWAAGRLARRDLSISEIALEAGFFDQSHLNRAFRSILGTTPARYRRTLTPPSPYRRLADIWSPDVLRLPREALRLATATGGRDSERAPASQVVTL